MNNDLIINAGVFVFYQYFDFKNLTVLQKNNIKTPANASDIGKA